jgi:ABC-2 type transport system permease protein
MTSAEAPRGSLAAESVAIAGQLMTHWRRGPAVTIQALLLPTFLLITYYLLVGTSVTRMTGADSLFGLVPTCAVAGAMFGALAAGVTIPVERDSGLLSQLWMLPVHRASALTGRLLAEAARTLAATLLITAVGVGLGLRFHGGWWAFVAFLAVPVAVAVVFSTAVIAIAVRSRRGTVLVWLGVPAISAVFASSGATPVDSLPGWMGPLIRHQPMAPTIEAMRTLAEGEPAWWPLLWTLSWGVVIAAVVVPLAVRGYRAAAEAGP